jgi:hypothetical protein
MDRSVVKFLSMDHQPNYNFQSDIASHFLIIVISVYFCFLRNIIEYIVAHMRGEYIRRAGLTTGFIGSHSYTQLQCIRSYSSLQFTITLA